MKEQKKIVQLYQAMLGLTDLTWDETGRIKIGEEFLTSPNGKEQLVLPYQEHYSLDTKNVLIFTPGHEEVTRLPSFTVMLYRNALLAKLSARAQELLVVISKKLADGEELSVGAKLLIKGLPSIGKNDAVGVAKYLLQDTLEFNPLEGEDDDAPRTGKATKVWTFKIATNREVEQEGESCEYLRVGMVKQELLESMRADMSIGQLIPPDLKVTRKSLLTLMSLLEWLNADLEEVFPVDGHAACIRSLIDFGNAYHERLNSACELFGLPSVELVNTKRFFKNERLIGVMLKEINSAPYNSGSLIKRGAKKIEGSSLMNGLQRPDLPPPPPAHPVAAPQLTPPPPTAAAPVAQPIEHELPPEGDLDGAGDSDLAALRKIYGTTQQVTPPGYPGQYPGQPMAPPAPALNAWGKSAAPAHPQFAQPQMMQRPMYPQQQPQPQFQAPLASPPPWDINPPPVAQPMYPQQQPQPQFQAPPMANTAQGYYVPTAPIAAPVPMAPPGHFAPNIRR